MAPPFGSEETADLKRRPPPPRRHAAPKAATIAAGSAPTYSCGALILSDEVFHRVKLPLVERGVESTENRHSALIVHRGIATLSRNLLALEYCIIEMVEDGIWPLATRKPGKARWGRQQTSWGECA
jgi:hypothetical protein